MQFSERFSDLPSYPFPRLRALLDRHPPGGERLDMSIGEPRHPPPAFVSEVLQEHVGEFGRYPPNDGSEPLLRAISDWLLDRYRVSVDPETRIMALNGSREGLFNACLALCPERKSGRRPVVLMPNPFYQVYAVAAAAAGAEPVFVPAPAETGFLPDFEGLAPAVLERTAVAYICTPSNPQGAVAPRAYLARLLELAEARDFLVFSDECYSEIYRGAPPPGVLECATEAGADPERVIAFNSLSKRSNLPGLRSGFVAGGERAMAEIRKLRAYSGAPLPLPLQRVAERAWADEAHVVENRASYVRKYDVADAVFAGLDRSAYRPPAAGLFLWIRTADGESAALDIWRRTGVRVLPGAYLGRDEAAGSRSHAWPFIRVSVTVPSERLGPGLRSIRKTIFGDSR